MRGWLQHGDGNTVYQNHVMGIYIPTTTDIPSTYLETFSAQASPAKQTVNSIDFRRWMNGVWPPVTAR